MCTFSHTYSCKNLQEQTSVIIRPTAHFTCVLCFVWWFAWRKSLRDARARWHRRRLSRHHEITILSLPLREKVSHKKECDVVSYWHKVSLNNIKLKRVKHYQTQWISFTVSRDTNRNQWRGDGEWVDFSVSLFLPVEFSIRSPIFYRTVSLMHIIAYWHISACNIS